MVLQAQFPDFLAASIAPEAMIAQGGIARVWKGTHRALGLSVAVKVSLKVLPDPAAKVLAAESAIARDLTHPRVVALHEAGVQGGIGYAVSDLVAGASLARKLRAGTLEPEGAFRLIAELASGLSALHAAGLVHRDLHPGNVLLTGAGVALVSDAGLSAFRLGTDVRQGGGVPGYMAPEQLRGDGAVPASDIYALGCLLFQLLTGSPPWGPDGPAGWFKRVAAGERVDLRPVADRLSPQRLALLDQCLAPEASHRFRDGAALLAVLGGSPQPGSAGVGGDAPPGPAGRLPAPGLPPPRPSPPTSAPVGGPDLGFDPIAALLGGVPGPGAAPASPPAPARERRSTAPQPIVLTPPPAAPAGPPPGSGDDLLADLVGNLVAGSPGASPGGSSRPVSAPASGIRPGPGVPAGPPSSGGRPAPGAPPGPASAGGARPAPPIPGAPSPAGSPSLPGQRPAPALAAAQAPVAPSPAPGAPVQGAPTLVVSSLEEAAGVAARTFTAPDLAELRTRLAGQARRAVGLVLGIATLLLGARLAPWLLAPAQPLPEPGPWSRLAGEVGERDPTSAARELLARLGSPPKLEAMLSAYDSGNLPGAATWGSLATRGRLPAPTETEAELVSRLVAANGILTGAGLPPAWPRVQGALLGSTARSDRADGYRAELDELARFLAGRLAEPVGKDSGLDPGDASGLVRLLLSRGPPGRAALTRVLGATASRTLPSVLGAVDAAAHSSSRVVVADLLDALAVHRGSLGWPLAVHPPEVLLGLSEPSAGEVSTRSLTFALVCLARAQWRGVLEASDPASLRRAARLVQAGIPAAADRFGLAWTRTAIGVCQLAGHPGVARRIGEEFVRRALKEGAAELGRQALDTLRRELGTEADAEAKALGQELVGAGNEPAAWTLAAWPSVPERLLGLLPDPGKAPQATATAASALPIGTRVSAADEAKPGDPERYSRFRRRRRGR